MSQHKIYLNDIPLDEAWARLIAALSAGNAWQPLEGEVIPLDQALNRVTAAPVWARLSAPHYHASAMDGYAVRAAATASASDAAPVKLPIGDERGARYLDTGDPLPPWADAVIPIENVQVEENVAIEIRAAVTPWSHVRPMGEDMVATELVLPSNHRLRPVDLGAIAGSGHTQVLVRRKPRVAVIPTGTELVSIGTDVRPGDIIEYNSLVLAAQVAQWGGQADRHAIVVDNLEAIVTAVHEAAADHDLVLLNAGSSAGSEDFSAQVVERLGALLVHGIAVRPGHPVILGTLPPSPDSGRVVPIIGVPGYPVSAALTAEIFVEPLLSRWLGQAARQPAILPATISRKVLSPMGDDEYMRVTVGRVGDKVIATPLSRGAGVITSLVRADGIVRVPRLSEGLQIGDRVDVHLYRQPREIENTVVAIGSHDLCLDLLGQYLAEQTPGMRLASANVGSLGGLLALKRGEAHLAGTHLLDPDSGEYNLRYLRQYLAGVPVVLVTLVGREQGLIVAPGNPRGLNSLADLVQPGLRFVNRQRGAGTRVLLDYELNRLGLPAESIDGYDREEFTHLAVAAAVASGAAEAGLGIHSAAAALGLDFVPLFSERYDLAIPRSHYESPLLQPVLSVLKDPAFQTAVGKLAGYDPRPMGTVVAEVL